MVLITYIAFFAISQGAVIWVYIGEVFPNAVRSKGQGVGNASHWIMNTIIALEFPVLVAQIRPQRRLPSSPYDGGAVSWWCCLFIRRPRGRRWKQLQRRLVPGD